MANAFFMRPGSSVVELMPYQYEQHPGANSLSVFNAQVGRSSRAGTAVCGGASAAVTLLATRHAGSAAAKLRANGRACLRAALIRVPPLPPTTPCAGPHLPAAVVGGGGV